jgi:hypothetical protein
MLPLDADGGSSSSSGGSSSAKEEIFFCRYSCTSMQKSAILALIRHISTLGNISRARVINALGPQNVTHAVVQCISTEGAQADNSPEAVFGRLVSRGVVLKDVSCTEEANSCFLSKAEYERPYILNLNGRSYERDNILDAIQRTLSAEPPQPLQLEEDFLVYPEQLRHLVLYPNLSLGSRALIWPRGSLPEAAAVARFSIADVQAHSFPEFSHWLDSTTNSAQLQAAELYHTRRKHHGSAHDVNFFVNVRVDRVAFPRVFIRWSMSFKNALFTNCFFHYDLWGDIGFFGCKFSDCSFLVSYVDRAMLGGTWRSCDFENCTFYRCSTTCESEVMRIPGLLVEHGGCHEGTRTYFVPPNIVSGADMTTLSSQELQRRIDVTTGRIAPLADDCARPRKFNPGTAQWVDG